MLQLGDFPQRAPFGRVGVANLGIENQPPRFISCPHLLAGNGAVLLPVHADHMITARIR